MKKLIMTISNEGSAGKTMIAKLIKEALMRRGIPHATYLCDKDHTELIQTYGDEVKFFDLREDSEALINSLAEDVEYILVDFPASSYDELYKIFGSMKVFIGSFAAFDAKPYFATPVATDKSILSINRLASLLQDVDDSFNIVYVMNEGLMKNKGEIYEAFDSNPNVTQQLADGTACQVSITTKFTPNFSNIVKKEKLREYLTKPSNPMDKVLMLDLLRQSDAQFGEAFGMDKIDDRTDLEKGLGVDTTKKIKGKLKE